MIGRVLFMNSYIIAEEFIVFDENGSDYSITSTMYIPTMKIAKFPCTYDGTFLCVCITNSYLLSCVSNYQFRILFVYLLMINVIHI